jgi:predicted RNA-binding protein (virulence factor B family)
MFPEAALGRTVSLVVVDLGPHGARLSPELSDGEPVSILLPRRETPDETRLGDVLEVFVYQDSEDRPTATRLRPKLQLGEVAFLEVRELTAFGAFCDWGLTKDLLVPLAEQTTDLARGDRIAVGLYVDDTGRLAGTMRVSELLRERPRYRVGDWIEGEAWRRDPALGVFVILERRSVALLPVSEPNRLRRGEAGRFRIAKQHPDGKVEVSLRDVAHKQVDDDAERILAVLRDRPGTHVGDRSSPEHVDALFGLSKKAFKRAVGGLYKQGLVEIDEGGFVRLK